MKICVIIPTYNESKEISRLIKEIKQQNLHVLVIDDGSTDSTGQIAKDAGAEVLINEHNLGKGSSLIKGFEHALKAGFDAVITLDGDGQHSPLDLPVFLAAANASDSQFFVGNRMHQTKGMPLIRIITNKFMSWLLSLVARQNIPDSQCGFRLIKKEALGKLNLRTTKYEIESEMLIRASRLGFKIESVAITTIYAGAKSKINPFMDTIRFFKFLLRELWTTRP